MANFNKRFFGMVVLSLILFTGIFLIKEKCFAYTYSENFDSYSVGTALTEVLDVPIPKMYRQSASTGIIATTSYSSLPNSLRVNGGGTASNIYFQYPEMSGGSYYFKFDNASQSFPIALYNNLGTLISFFTWDSTTVFRVYCNQSGTHYFTGHTMDTNWHQLSWENYSTSTIIWKYDGVNDIGEDCKVNNPANTIIQMVWQGIAHAGYIDNINTYVPAEDDINLTHPEDYSMQDKNLLYWAYNFTISSTSYAAYDRFYTYLYYIPPVLDATTTRIEEAWLKPATQPETTYVVIYNSGIYIPLYLGEYAAGVYLTGEKGYDTDILAESDITFTMISSTSTPPTAWCSGLCNDLSTSTSAWWKFWDDTIDKTTTGLTCAGRYFVCYSFYPHTYTQELFGEVYNKFKLVFPFNIFFEITSTIDNVFASTTMASTTGSFGLPMIRKVGTTSQYYILPLLTSSTTSNFLGNSNANLLRFSLSSIIYTFYIVGIILILW